MLYLKHFKEELKLSKLDLALLNPSYDRQVLTVVVIELTQHYQLWSDIRGFA